MRSVQEIRNPKAEGRKKSEGRNPKVPVRLQNRGLSSEWSPRSVTSSSDFGFQISAFGFRPSRESGVALVITLIMLSVITFMAIAFLVLSRGERSSVGTATDQSLARLAADNALERVQAELVAPMIVSGNASSFGLMVSTNYISQIGFQGGNAFPAILTSATNVSYNY